jgi:tripartite-type tricarboxylate transporter receptor subunit TctC
MKSQLTIISTIGVVASTVSLSAMAGYPDKPIRVIVPYGAGGDSDLTTRIWADAVEGVLDNPVAVINQAGGSGSIGTTAAANAQPDGYTLINAGLGNMQVTPNFSDVPYDFDSFTPIVKLSSVPLAIVVSSDSPYTTFEEFVDGAKENTLTQGSWGAASSGTILANIIANKADYEVRYVHADTTAESVVSLVGGHIDSAVSFPPAYEPYLKSDSVRLLAVNKVHEEYPDVPTFADLGIEGDFEGWSGIFAPKGVPQEVVDRLIEASEQVMQDPQVIAAFENVGADVDFQHGEEWIRDMNRTYEIMKEAAE